MAAGTVVVQWEPTLPLDLIRLEHQVLRWRGGVRYGGADVTVVGVVEAAGAAGSSPVLVRSLSTRQPFGLRVVSADPAAKTLRAGAIYRIWGRVIKESEGKDHVIWLQLQRAEPLPSLVAR